MFFVDYHTSYSKTINAPVKAVIDFLHDPVALMRLNPVIIDVRRDPEDPAKYTIVDQLTMLGWKKQLTYTARVTITESGMEAESSAGAGTTTISRFSAKEVGEGVTELQERASVNCFFLLLPFIKGVLDKAHKESHERLKNRLEGGDSSSKQ
ncbi:hypothetical protein C8F01DRAFT_194448 [Mycena amicta]|nr:hypothetical protein C8F01DRAFT_995027 [Mycena amicta]KAJ7055480.1 hypothetical protein C8F01DRAFT_994066 [Mycena amicta]KAJ7060436.1 hypothetical protein C8F01DRAFT_194448 [Mycena amicta]